MLLRNIVYTFGQETMMLPPSKHIEESSQVQWEVRKRRLRKPKGPVFITVKVKVSMKTKFNTLMFSRFHLSEMDSLPSKTYKAVISALLHYFYDDEEPDFSKLRKPEVAMKYFKRIASYIETGLNKTA